MTFGGECIPMCRATESDYSEPTYWDDYVAAFEHAMLATSTKDSPWFVMPANHKWFRSLAASQIIADTMEGLHMSYLKPTVDLAEISANTLRPNERRRVPASTSRRAPRKCRSGSIMMGWFFSSLRGYRIEWLPRDLVAGLMLSAIAIPGQLATARLAGMPPQTGLYAFAAGSLAFAAFGANRFMSVAADSTIAPIFAGGLAAIAVAGSANYAAMATLLALMVGIVLVAVGVLRAGWLATLLSIPVTTGFLAGISVHIIVGELPTLLGASEEHGHVLVRLVHVLSRVPEANPYTLALGAGVLIVTTGTARISSRVPGALIGLVGAGVAVALFHLGARGVSLLRPSRYRCRTSPCRPCPVGVTGRFVQNCTLSQAGAVLGDDT